MQWDFYGLVEREAANLDRTDQRIVSRELQGCSGFIKAASDVTERNRLAGFFPLSDTRN
jgi:hypothetical protein